MYRVILYSYNTILEALLTPARSVLGSRVAMYIPYSRQFIAHETPFAMDITLAPRFILFFFLAFECSYTMISHCIRYLLGLARALCPTPLQATFQGTKSEAPPESRYIIPLARLHKQTSLLCRILHEQHMNCFSVICLLLVILLHKA